MPEPVENAAAKLEWLAVRAKWLQRDGKIERFVRLERPRFFRLYVRPRGNPRVRLQLEDFHRSLPRGLSRGTVPPGPGQLRQLRRPALGIRQGLQRADGGRAPRPAAGRLPCLQEMAGAGAAIPRRRTAAVWRHLADPVSEHHGRMVSARARRLDPVADGSAKDAQRGRVLLPRRNRAVRARARRGGTGCLHGNLCRGR